MLTLPVNIIEPDAKNDPVNSIVSAVVDNKVCPPVPEIFNDPVKMTVPIPSSYIDPVVNVVGLLNIAT
jgi:hypothetical protein